MLDLLTAHGDALLFYAFAFFAVASAAAVVSLRNPMYCAGALLVTFVSVAALFLLRHAELVAIVQLFVYGGGIMVLFLFVIMLINLHRLAEVRLFVGQAPVALVVALALVALFVWIYAGVPVPEGPAADPAALAQIDGETVGNTEAVGWRLYRDYLVPFEIASLFLLVAMIGAVVLGRRN